MSLKDCRAKVRPLHNRFTKGLLAYADVKRIMSLEPSTGGVGDLPQDT